MRQPSILVATHAAQVPQLVLQLCEPLVEFQRVMTVAKNHQRFLLDVPQLCMYKSFVGVDDQAYWPTINK